MSDPMLSAHRLGGRVFSIGGNVQPLSIRDQITRGWLFVDRAFSEKLIAPNALNPFVVVGAGAAGVTAAIRAAELGVRTVLVEQKPQAFNPQAGCTTRWLDPTLYDWPIDHWGEGAFPWDPALPSPPLPWPTADWAHVLATLWQSTLHTAQLRYAGQSRLAIYYDSELHAPPNLTIGASAIPIQLRGVRTGLTRSLTAEIVLLAMGFGEERCAVQPQGATGLPFWRSDSIVQPNLGLAMNAPPSVLVSGGGDGAIQDFLRIMIGATPLKRLYEACKIPADMELRLFSAQERAQRAFAWGQGGKWDHEVLERLHQTFDSEAKKALQLRQVKQQLNSTIASSVPDTKVVYQCTHFGNCYGLNRFLALLVARFLKDDRNVQVLYPGRYVRSIQGINGHTCQGKPLAGPQACYGADHRVELVHKTSCGNTRGSSTPADTFRASVLILRHGFELSPLARRLSPPFSRQLLPYYIPQ